MFVVIRKDKYSLYSRIKLVWRTELNLKGGIEMRIHSIKSWLLKVHEEQFVELIS